MGKQPCGAREWLWQGVGDQILGQVGGLEEYQGWILALVFFQNHETNEGIQGEPPTRLYVYHGVTGLKLGIEGEPESIKGAMCMQALGLGEG